jgi:sulfur carrier protein
MEVNINHQTHTVPEKASLLQLLEAQSLSEKKGIAVAVNNKVIPRASWTSHQLNQNDSITIIRATQGG